MACSCKGRTTQQFLWVPPNEGDAPRVYDSELQAKAKVIRKGGTYVPYDPNRSLAAQVSGG